MRKDNVDEITAGMEKDFSNLLGTYEQVQEITELTLRVAAQDSHPLTIEIYNQMVDHNRRMYNCHGYAPFVKTPGGRLFSLI